MTRKTRFFTLFWHFWPPLKIFLPTGSGVMPKIVIFDDFGQKPFFPLPKFREILDLFFTILNPVALQYEIFWSCKNDHFWVTKKITILTPFFHFLHFWKNPILGSFLGHFLDHFFDPFLALLAYSPPYFWQVGVSNRGQKWPQKWTHFWGTSQKCRPKPLPVNSSVSRTIKFDPILGHFGPPKTSFLAFFGKKVIFWHFHEAKVRDSSIFDHFLKPVFWHVFDTEKITKCSKSWFFLAF